MLKNKPETTTQKKLEKLIGISINGVKYHIQSFLEKSGQYSE